MKSKRSCFAICPLVFAIVANWIASPSFGFAIEALQEKHTPGEWVYYRDSDSRTFCYDGDVHELNAYLQKDESKSCKVILRPGPSKITTLDRNTPVPCTWSMEQNHLSIMGYKEVFDLGPTITIYIDETIALNQLNIPSCIQLISNQELKERYRTALTHPYYLFRSFACNLLTSVDPYDSKSALQIAKLLKDPDLLVRSSAARALARYGTHAKGALRALKTEYRQTPRDVVLQAINQIKSAPPTNKDECIFHDRYKQISEYVLARNRDQ